MKSRLTTNRIVIHHTLSTDVSIHTVRKWHVDENGWSDVGYHFLIRFDGTVEKGRDLHFVGAHKAGSNSDSIGIALTGDFNKHHPTEEQYKALSVLIASLTNVYQDIGIVEPHRVGNNACPAPLFNFNRINS